MKRELDLLIREIEDPHTQQNFIRLQRFLDTQVILQGRWRLHSVRFDKAVDNFKHPHQLGFIPYDVILLETIGNRNVEFNHNKFDRTNVDISVEGPCYIRFLVGRYEDRQLAPSSRDGLTNVSVGGAGPGVTPLTQICKQMDCDASLAVNDWVYQSTTTNNRAVKTTSNSQVEPTIGIVKNKISPTVCEVLLQGVYTGLALGGRGKFWLGDAGSATFTFPSSGTGKFVRSLGISFGDGSIYVNPDLNGWELDDG